MLYWQMLSDFLKHQLDHNILGQRGVSRNGSCSQVSAIQTHYGITFWRCFPDTRYTTCSQHRTNMQLLPHVFVFLAFFRICLRVNFTRPGIWLTQIYLMFTYQKATFLKVINTLILKVSLDLVVHAVCCKADHTQKNRMSVGKKANKFC